MICKQDDGSVEISVENVSVCLLRKHFPGNCSRVHRRSQISCCVPTASHHRLACSSHSASPTFSVTLFIPKLSSFCETSWVNDALNICVNPFIDYGFGQSRLINQELEFLALNLLACYECYMLGALRNGSTDSINIIRSDQRCSLWSHKR